MSLGDTLKDKRLDDGHTLREIAEVLEISAMYLSQIERNTRIPKDHKIIKAISEYLEEDFYFITKAVEIERFKKEIKTCETRILFLKNSIKDCRKAVLDADFWEVL